MTRTLPAPTPAPRRRYVSVKDAAEYLDVSDRTLRKMIADDRLTGYRNGSKLVRLEPQRKRPHMKPYGGAV